MLDMRVNIMHNIIDNTMDNQDISDSLVVNSTDNSNDNHSMSLDSTHVIRILAEAAVCRLIDGDRPLHVTVEINAHPGAWRHLDGTGA